MESMYLHEVEAKPADGALGDRMAQMRAEGRPIPQIWHLFAFRPDRTRHLADFTHAVMRGPSPLSPGIRELIAAFTSAQNQCPF
jgi:alkylhydroperoxidase family enzyme